MTVDRHLSAPATVRRLGALATRGPAYRALADALRSAVLSGAIAPHTRLPSERDLAAALGVSRTTTTAAYQELRAHGLARAHTGVGTVTVLPQDEQARRSVTGGDTPWERSGPGPDVISLRQAALSAPPTLHAAVLRAVDRLPAYLAGPGYHPLGIEPLRAVIAERYARRGTPTSPDQILVTSGAQHAVATLLGTLVRPGDRVVVQSPTYVHALDAARAAGARLVGLPVGRPGAPAPEHPPFDVDLLASTLRGATPRVTYLIPDHHNPTGYSLTDDEREQVRALARRHQSMVVGDETVTDLTLDGAPPSSFAGPGTASSVVTVGSASKVLWGGLRVGWVRGPSDLVARLSRYREAVDVTTSVLDQLVVADLLGRADEVLAERLPRVREQRDVLVDGLRAAVPGWTVPRPAGGLALWIGLGAPLAHAFAARAAAEGVLVNPGPALTPDGSGTGFVRATYAQDAETLTRAVPRLARAWAATAPER
ncbi:GntR family transcriptional regulator [Sediminihabitans luteus]|nr:GntR family transcriptional regulator [Sediminihabitans luteus]